MSAIGGKADITGRGAFRKNRTRQPCDRALNGIQLKNVRCRIALSIFFQNIPPAPDRCGAVSIVSVTRVTAQNTSSDYSLFVQHGRQP
jgi:hypothetical protein